MTIFAMYQKIAKIVASGDLFHLSVVFFFFNVILDDRLSTASDCLTNSKPGGTLSSTESNKNSWD